MKYLSYVFRLSVASYSKSPPRDRIINHQIEGARTQSNSRSPSPPSQADQRSIRYIQDCLEIKICSKSILLYNIRVSNCRYFTYFLYCWVLKKDDLRWKENLPQNFLIRHIFLIIQIYKYQDMKILFLIYILVIYAKDYFN